MKLVNGEIIDTDRFADKLQDLQNRITEIEKSDLENCT